MSSHISVTYFTNALTKNTKIIEAVKFVNNIYFSGFFFLFELWIICKCVQEYAQKWKSGSSQRGLCKQPYYEDYFVDIANHQDVDVHELLHYTGTVLTQSERALQTTLLWRLFRWYRYSSRCWCTWTITLYRNHYYWITDVSLYRQQPKTEKCWKLLNDWCNWAEKV